MEPGLVPKDDKIKKKIPRMSKVASYNNLHLFLAFKWKIIFNELENSISYLFNIFWEKNNLFQHRLVIDISNDASSAQNPNKNLSRVFLEEVNLNI